jgi:hypothetical protein
MQICSFSDKLFGAKTSRKKFWVEQAIARSQNENIAQEIMGRASS